LYGENRVREEIPRDYYMSIYPVTNDQYKEFMLANGYGSEDYWSNEGWAWKQKKQVDSPEYWINPKWTKTDHPVVGVSYYEAEAYATWAGKRLPTEQEWEKAARGTEGQMYPWGDEFDGSKSNYGKYTWFTTPTTPVTNYPEGQSPYGCYGMAGNAWDWCASWYDQSNHQRVIRGGSWDFDLVGLRSSFRGWNIPDSRLNFIGFRLAQDAP